MNENTLNGLINLFAIFSKQMNLDREKARASVLFYLFSHFGVRSQNDYIALFDELTDLYSDPDFMIDAKEIIRNVCSRLVSHLTAEEQLLLLLRFMEFAKNNSSEWTSAEELFGEIAVIFSVDAEMLQEMTLYVDGGISQSILTINGNEKAEGPFHICRNGLSGEIRVLYISKFDRMVFTYLGQDTVFFNDMQVTPRLFYSWQRSGVVKSSRIAPVYFSDLRSTFEQDAELHRSVLSGREVQFTFSNSANGIKKLSFDLNSGELVAIMGGSGVGKSTLLSLLNGTLMPNQGEITINGHSLNTEQAKSQIGFVPQDDLLIEELTVYQNLWYTARLCFANRTPQQIEEKVDSLLKELGLYSIRKLKVGSPIKKTISGGQRKRLNIALELIREPSILYLDEPTSGLSSTDSEKVVILLKEQTHKGRLVVVNIHQPSSEIYKLFDRLWLFDKGGYPIYDGNPIEAITYFKRLANYTDQEISICNTCGNVNPELVLNIIEEKKIDDTGEKADVRKMTPQEWHDCYLSTLPEFTPVTQGDLPPSEQKRPSVWKQFCIFIDRNLHTKLANKQYLAISLLEAPILALIVALLTRYVPDEGYTLLTNKNLVSYIFMAVIVIIFIGMSMSAEEIIKDKALLKREQFLQLSRNSYLFSKLVFLAVVSAIQSFLFLIVGNTMIGIGFDLFPSWWLMLWATAFLSNLIGLLLSQTLSSVVAIYISIPILLIPQILLCGVVVKFDDLSKYANDSNTTPFVADVIPSRWAFEALVVDTYVNNDFNKDFFIINRNQYLAQYYRSIHLKDVQALSNEIGLITDPQERALKEKTLNNELAVLARVAKLDRVKGEHISTFFDRVDMALKERSENFTALKERVQKEMVETEGVESFNTRKKSSCNTALEDMLMNSQPTHFNREANHRIHPKVGVVYLDHENPFGRAPFYAHTKKVADLSLSTYQFNLLVLIFFAILVIIAIFAEFPTRLFKDK